MGTEAPGVQGGRVKMLGGAYEDGEETKSDFLARMLMMGRIEIDQDNKTLKSNTTCHEEQAPEVAVKKAATIKNPMKHCDIATSAQYEVVAKSFFSTYEVSNCTDISLEACGSPVRSPMGEEWHHTYRVRFEVAASTDPAPYLTRFFDENVKRLGEAAVKISYVETAKLDK